MSKIYELAKKIKEAGRIIAEDDINKGNCAPFNSCGKR